MTQELTLFVTIAEIAGVFVGFGALISVARNASIDAEQLGHIRAVVTIGLVVVVAALVPVGLGQYGLTNRTLWTLSCLVFLVLIWAVNIFSLRQAENRVLLLAKARAHPVLSAFFWVLLEIPMQLPLILAILDVFADQEVALYTTALVLNLFQAAFVLAQFVYSQQSQPNS